MPSGVEKSTADWPKRNGFLDDQFPIRQKLAEGAFGIAWLVQSRDGKQRYVLKEMKTDIATDGAREAMAMELAALEHATNNGRDCDEHLVCYYGHFLARNNAKDPRYRAFVQMQYIPGTDMERVLADAQQGVRRPQPVALNDAISVTTDTLQALEHLHRHNVAHRDIKPANIMLNWLPDKNGVPRLNATLIDVGLACTDDSSCQIAAGTPIYKQNHSPAYNLQTQKAADIYALGLSLVEFLNQKEFVDEFGEKQHEAHLRGETDPAARGIIYANSRVIDSLVRHMLSYQPKDRPTAAYALRYLSENQNRIAEPVPIRLPADGTASPSFPFLDSPRPSMQPFVGPGRVQDALLTRQWENDVALQQENQQQEKQQQKQQQKRKAEQEFEQAIIEAKKTEQQRIAKQRRRDVEELLVAKQRAAEKGGGRPALRRVDAVRANLNEEYDDATNMGALPPLPDSPPSLENTQSLVEAQQQQQQAHWARTLPRRKRPL
jgi:serine/threonine protein kinase